MKNDNECLVPTYVEISSGFIDLESASRLSGMHPEMIMEFIRAGLVVVARKDRSGNPYFGDESIFLLRQIEHLRNVERVHLRTIRWIVQLMNRVEAAEREARGLRDRIR